MNKEMIISSSDHDTRVAILEDDQVVEIFIEREISAASSATSTRAGSPRSCPACSPPSLTSASSATRSSTSRKSSTPSRSSNASSRATMRTRPTRPCRRRSGRRSRRGRRRAAGAPPTAPALPQPCGAAARAPTAAAATASEIATGPQAEDRRPAEGRPGSPRPGRQGAARHQGRAAHLARHDAGPLPGLHADGRPRRRLPQDRIARRARPPPRHRPRVPRGARLHRRRHHPHRRVAAAPKEDIVSDLVLLPPGLDRDPPARWKPASAGGAVPGAEPRHQAAARPADRRLHAPSASTTSRSTGAWSRSSSGSCRTCCRG